MEGSRYPALKSAPITEAVIDMRVSRAAPFRAELLKLFRNEFVAYFPEVEEQRQVEAVVELATGGVLRQSMSDNGVRRLVMRSQERAEALIVTDGGFAFSKLRPYSTWPQVFDAARRWWARYSEVAGVELLSRVAVRYINQFTIPMSALSEYLYSPPAPPRTVESGELQESFTRLALHDPEAEVDTILVQAVTFTDRGVSVILDIDASLSGAFPANDDLWAHFTELRDAKNRIFFGSITAVAQKEFNR